jgi:hypothetical protein
VEDCFLLIIDKHPPTGVDEASQQVAAHFIVPVTESDRNGNAPIGELLRCAGFDPYGAQVAVYDEDERVWTFRKGWGLIIPSMGTHAVAAFSEDMQRKSHQKGCCDRQGQHADYGNGKNAGQPLRICARRLVV